MDHGEIDGSRTQVKEDLGTPEEAETATATEEEVEEFYTILRRVHEVVRYFGKRKREKEGEGEGEGEGAKKKGESWTPSFQWEDFEEELDFDSKRKKTKKMKKDGDEAVKENHQVVPVILDLNVAPEPVVERI